MAEGIHWKTISRFESHDFVANWYLKAHGKAAKAEKVRQVNACFAHGRECFRNAGRSEMSVKPLLLYYGVLSCCRGVILANDPGKKEESLKPRHGLEPVDWQQLAAHPERRDQEGLGAAHSGDRRNFRRVGECVLAPENAACFSRSHERNGFHRSATGRRAVRNGRKPHVA